LSLPVYELLKHAMEGSIEGTRLRGGRHKQLPDDRKDIRA